MKAPARHPAIGALFVLAGIGIGLMVHLQPQGLRAPAWVAYAAALSFSLAGLSLLLQAFDLSRRLQGWVIVLLVACLLTPLVWIAVANPDGTCEANLLGVFLPAPQWVCRTGIALMLLVGLLILALTVRHARRAPRDS